ncbi:MAG: hypothetical protein AB1750_15460 [Chloroflexota bacterium]
MPKRDEKHSMAEDYLAQIKWRGEHPYRKGNPPEPDWKYKPVYGKQAFSFAGTKTGIFLLVALIAVAGIIIFEGVTTAQVDLILPIIAIVLLVLIFLVTRQPK